jgi:3',5'-cyclic AMP phosphodiesterase CpdA
MRRFHYIYKPSELTSPFRDPLAQDARETGLLSEADVTPSFARALVQRADNLVALVFLFVVIAVLLSVGQSLIARVARAISISPCAEFTSSCVNAFIDAALNLRGAQADDYIRELRAPMTVVAGLLIGTFFVFGIYLLARQTALWLSQLDAHESSQLVLRVQNAFLDPTKGSRHHAVVHALVGCTLLSIGLVPFAGLDFERLRALAVEAPDYVAEMHRVRFYHAIPVSACITLFLALLPEVIVQFRDALALAREGRPEELKTWESDEAVEPPFIRIAHWSDLHLTAGGGTLEGGTGGNEFLRQLVEKFAAQLRTVDAIVVTGDITDAGLAAEWAQFLEIVPDEIRGKIVLVPGNHDINIVSPVRKGAVESIKKYGFRLRLVRFLAVLDLIQGERAWVYFRGERVSVRALLHNYGETLNRFADEAHEDWLSSVGEAWRDTFPMVVDIPGSSFSIVVLDSIEFSSTLATNAYGHVGSEQLRKIARLKEAQDGRRFLFALHHHIALPSKLARGNLLKRLQPFFLLLQNPRSVVRVLREYEPAVVLHGHRHVEYGGRLHKLDIVSAPSTTLGCEAQGRDTPGFFILEVGCAGSGAAVKSKAFVSLNE